MTIELKNHPLIQTTAGEPRASILSVTAPPHRHSNRTRAGCWAILAAAFVSLAASADAASVGFSGYTNDFSARPAASDFSTSSGLAGDAGDITSAEALDAYVQNVAASAITAQVTDSSPANPPGKLATAQWTSGGSAYLMTRPTGNRAGVLLARLVNQTGTNCTMLHFRYQLTVGVSVSEEVPGQRLFYSFSTASNTWTSVPAVSGVNASGTVSADVPLNQTWTNGGTLYLLWVDDNAESSTESAYEIDNFFAAAYYLDIPFSATLTAPAEGQHFGVDTVISARVALTGSPTNVSYYVDGVLVAESATAPFTPVILPAQALGTHTVYATAQDASNTFVTTATNTFVVDLTLSGTLSTNTILYATNSPYSVGGNLTVPSGITLTIEPGTTVQLGAGVRVIVNGLLTAVGAPDRRIRFTRSTASDWSGFSFIGNHQSNVFAYADFEYANGAGNGGSAVVHINDSQVTFLRDTFFHLEGHKCMDIWYPQVIIRNSVFGDIGGAYMFMLENLNPNGWFIADGNLFGANTGDTDIFHLNHISVKNGPKAIIVNNVFTGAGDDHVDDNESDSHIEGNLFMNFTTNHPPRSASCAITTGEGTGVSTNLHTQRLVVVRNIFWGCDYGIINKDGSAVEIYNCVFVGNRGGIILDEPWRTDSGPGRSCYVEGCIFWNNWPENGVDQGVFAYLTNSEAFTTGRYYRGATQVTVNNSILPAQLHHLGTGNLDVDPRFVYPTNRMNLSPTNPAFAGGFDGFDANAFLLTNRLVPDVHLLPGSPAIGAGFNGSDLGVYVSGDATITGAPASPTAQTNVALTVAGLDIGGYKYRLLGPGFTNAWSPERQQFKYVSAIALSGATATATATGHGFANGDLIEVKGADSLCPYYNGTFTIRSVTANTFAYTVAPGTNLLTGEPLTITWPIRNERVTDIWCRKPQSIELTGLADGTYRIEVVRQNTLGVWQDTNSPSRVTFTVATGPAPDSDGDGLTDPEEIIAGTDPHDRNSVLKAAAARLANGGFSILFQAVSNRTYTIQYRDSLGSGSWSNLITLPAGTTNALEQWIDPSGATPPARFYRLAIP